MDPFHGFNSSYMMSSALILISARRNEVCLCPCADVRTQAMYQMMDQGFVGLIFSCFIEDKNTKVRETPGVLLSAHETHKPAQNDAK